MDILPQIIVLAIISSAIYAVVAAGLTLTFGTLEFINFAHGDTAMAGAFSFYTYYILLGLNIVISAILAIFTIALIGVIIERTTFKPVRERQEFIPLILSIGIAIIIQALTIIFFGGGSQTFFQNNAPSETLQFFNGGINITITQITIIISSIVVLTFLYLFLKFTKIGKTIRAVSDNKEVAAIMGINVNQTISILFAIAAGLAAFGGILVAFDQNLHPQMGLALSVKAFAAIILGGVGRFGGAIIGAIIIAFSENLIVGLTQIHSSYKELIVFVIFILILIFKPYGLFGGKKEEVEAR